MRRTGILAGTSGPTGPSRPAGPAGSPSLRSHARPTEFGYAFHGDLSTFYRQAVAGLLFARELPGSSPAFAPAPLGGLQTRG